MDPDEESDKQIKREAKKTSILKRYVASTMFIFQPLWVRCCPILSDKSYGRYLEGQLRFVLYCGTFFWILYFIV